MKIAFVDHIFHKTTKSNLFFREILKRENSITDIWISSWYCKDLQVEALNSEKFDLILFFQIIPPQATLKLIKCKNKAWVPMYDDFCDIKAIALLRFLVSDIKILSFSKSVSSKTEKLGFDVLNLNYFPTPNFKDNDSNKLNVFLWQRIPEINWNFIKNIIKGNSVNKVVLRYSMDRDHSYPKPSLEDIKKYNIEIIEGWLTKEEYFGLFSDCNLFFAPRHLEGIGLSFLEAMAHGIPVVAPNFPTMNEYIEDGQTGYLYDVDNPKPIDFSNLLRVSKNLKATMTKGHKSWQNQQFQIQEFLTRPLKRQKKHLRLAGKLIIVLDKIKPK